MAEQYPEAGSPSILNGVSPYNELLKIYSLTYGVAFYFLPYDFKLTETFDIRWNQQTVFGRMDPIATYKGMGRSMNLSFKARQKDQDGSSPITFTADELLHSIDHLKKCLYPRYNSSQVMISPPLFRMQYKNLINAGQEQFEIKPENGVLSIITGFTANFMSEPNKIAFPTNDKSMAYPKVFDINITFTVLNENLVATQQTGILTNEYFYKYKHEHTHTGVGQAGNTTTPSTQGTGVDPATDAITAKITGKK
jgi:hypothetical protein